MKDSCCMYWVLGNICWGYTGLTYGMSTSEKVHSPEFLSQSLSIQQTGVLLKNMYCFYRSYHTLSVHIVHLA